jgi:DNA-binding transcriptional LysR family regulator
MIVNWEVSVIDISDMQIIKAIAEAGSINKAAEVLSMSQPTLSKKVSRLEQKIKLELFVRDNTGMLPTPAARFLINESENLTVQLHNLERQLELMAGMVGGVVKIGVGPITEQFLMSKVLLDFAERDYKFKISVVTMAVDSLIDQLVSSQIDIAVGIFSKDSVPEGCLTPLKVHEKMVVAVRNGHELAKQSAINLHELLNCKSVLPRMPKSLGENLGSAQLVREVKPDITCESYSMARLIVANTDYITIGPESLFHKEFLSGKLVMLELEEEIDLQFICLVKPESMKMPIVKEVVGIFAQYMS